MKHVLNTVVLFANHLFTQMYVLGWFGGWWVSDREGGSRFTVAVCTAGTKNQLEQRIRMKPEKKELKLGAKKHLVQSTRSWCRLPPTAASPACRAFCFRLNFFLFSM